MKYLKRFNESIEDIDSICKKYGIGNYTVNKDGTVDVNGDVNLSNMKYKQKITLTILPLKFGKVMGTFYCSYNKLTTLEGCPTEVGGDFYCSNNKLTTLEGCPTEVVGNFYCSFNKLTTLEGCTKEVVGRFDCSYNQLTMLKYCPKEVDGTFFCQSNQLTIINWNDIYTLNPIDFFLKANTIYEVYKIFPDFETFRDSLEWNYFKEPNIIIRSRFVEACEILSEETGIKIKIPKKINGYIFE